MRNSVFVSLRSLWYLGFSAVFAMPAVGVGADEVPVPADTPDLYAYDPSYYPSAMPSGSFPDGVPHPGYAQVGSGYVPTVPSVPGGAYPAEVYAPRGDVMSGAMSSLSGATSSVAPSMAGPQVPPMPQMPNWVQAWAGEMSDAERDQLEQVYKGLRRINYDLTGELMDASDLISETLKSDTRDPKRVGQAYGRYFDVQRRWIEAQIAAANRVDGLIAQVRARISQIPSPMAAPMTRAPIVIPPAPPAEPESPAPATDVAGPAAN